MSLDTPGRGIMETQHYTLTTSGHWTHYVEHPEFVSIVPLSPHGTIVSLSDYSWHVTPCFLPIVFILQCGHYGQWCEELDIIP